MGAEPAAGGRLATAGAMVENKAPMRRFRPIHGFAIVLAVCALVLVINYAVEGAFGATRGEKVQPGADGTVHIGIADLAPNQVRFYHFINRANQEVRFFVGRDESGTVQVAFDANEICFKTKRGYEAQEGWVVCRKCEKAFRLADVNAGGGGCKPVPLVHRVVGDQLVLAEDDILRGWRYFR